MARFFSYEYLFPIWGLALVLGIIALWWLGPRMRKSRRDRFKHVVTSKTTNQIARRENPNVFRFSGQCQIPFDDPFDPDNRADIYEIVIVPKSTDAH